jgi:hypothetical protein
LCFTLLLQLNCLEELKRPSPNGATGRADWVHIYHSVLPLLPLHNPREEAKVSSALRTAVAALVAKHSSAFRAASVAVWEIRFRVPDVSGAWRVLVSCPTGRCFGEKVKARPCYSTVFTPWPYMILEKVKRAYLGMYPYLCGAVLDGTLLSLSFTVLPHSKLFCSISTAGAPSFAILWAVVYDSCKSLSSACFHCRT